MVSSVEKPAGRPATVGYFVDKTFRGRKETGGWKGDRCVGEVESEQQVWWW